MYLLSTPSSKTYRSSFSFENLNDLQMESDRSGEPVQGEPVQDEVGLPVVTGVVETSNMFPENHARDDLGPVGVRFFGNSGLQIFGLPILCVGLGKGHFVFPPPRGSWLSKSRGLGLNLWCALLS